MFYRVVLSGGFIGYLLLFEGIIHWPLARAAENMELIEKFPIGNELFNINIYLFQDGYHIPR